MGIKKEFGQKIRRMRQKRGLTQEKLAEIIDVSQRTLSGIEPGESIVTAETFDKLVLALNTTSEELLITNHLKEPSELITEIKSSLDYFENEPQKLEFLYNMVRYLRND